MTARVRRSQGATGSGLRWAATSAWLLSVAAIAATLALYAGRGASAQPTGLTQSPVWASAIAVTGLVYASVGAFLVRRRSRDPIGWTLLGIGIGMAVVLPLGQVVEASTHSFRGVPTETLLAAWALTSVHMPASGAAAVLVMLLFPTGRLDWRFGRAALGLAVGGAVLLALSSALWPEGLVWYPTLPNPLQAPTLLAPLVTLMSLGGVAIFVGSLALAVACLAWRYRHGDPRLRRPLGWVALGAIAMAGSVALFYVGRYAGAAAGPQGERLAVVAAAGACLLPLAMVRFTIVTASQGQPTRDLTFLFTDLMDSTAMYESIGDVPAFDLVRLHFDTLRAVARRHRGEIVKTIGDALMARFLDPAGAVQAALEMFDELDRLNRRNGSGLVLKVGIHRGDAIIVSDRYRTDYFGQTVNIAARIGAIATPGEIVLSDVVRRGPAVSRLLEGCESRSERATLKGVTDDVLVHRVRPRQAGRA